MMNQTTMQRLGLIRYLYEAAMEESRRPEPFGLISILKFHDSVELFLDLACDKFGIPANKTFRFKDYWTELEKHLQNQTLYEKRSMERLNDARVSFKHHGNLPHATSIERFRVNVTDFFEENTLLIFDIEFSKVSMAYLIKNDMVRTTLEEASKLIEAGDEESAIAKIAIAFAQLLEEYESKTRTDFGRSPFSFDHSLSGMLSSIQTDNVAIADFANEVEDFANDVADAVADMQNAIKILALGLDYRRYINFQLLTPSAKKLQNGNYEVHPKRSKVETLTLDHCRFCYDFVIESAIELQAIELEVKVVPTSQPQTRTIDKSIIERLFSNSDFNSDQIN